MARDLKYFMRNREQQIVTAPGPDTFVDENGNVIELEIRVLSQAEVQKISNNYRKRSIATDRRGQPYIAGGEVVYKVEKDNARASRHIMVEALAYPDLKDKELMAFYGCVDVTEMPQLVFSRADEYAHVSRVVMAALGLGVGADDDETIEAAKN